MAKLIIDKETELSLGIDFGTTNCVVSVYIDGEPIVIPIDGSNVFPTAVMFESSTDELGKLSKVFGLEAKEAFAVYPETTVLNIKRLLGTGQKIKLDIEGKEYSLTPEEVAAEILLYLKEKATEYIEEELNQPCKFTSCVITVPANSTDKQKKMTRDAAILAGFDSEQTYLRLEPAAAAISYAINEQESRNILVYDFGGGTFDACVIGIEAGDPEPYVSILSTYGDNNLGGNDVDKIIMDIIYEEFKKQTDIDLFAEEANYKIPIARLEQASQKAKERLSSTKSTKVTLAPFLQEPEIININIEITKDDFYNHRRVNQLTDTKENFLRYKDKNLHDIIDITISCIDNCIESSGVSDIDQIFLVGGSSSLELVSEKITKKFGKEPFKSKISPALSISMGASIYANLIKNPTNIGPIIKEKTIHPLGLEVFGRQFFEIISPGIDIPEDGLTIESKELFYTNFDDVTSMAIVVYEDTSPTSDKSINRSGMKRLGGTTLHGIPKAKKGEEKVKVIFNVDRNNILKVRAVSESLGAETILSVDQMY